MDHIISRFTELVTAISRGGYAGIVRGVGMPMHNETKKTAISKAVKDAVIRRDDHRCIFCRRWGAPEAHIVRRSQGGLGIEENVVCACRECHRAMDEGRERKYYQRKAEFYMRSHYPDWDRKKLTYRKYGIKWEEF